LDTNRTGEVRRDAFLKAVNNDAQLRAFFELPEIVKTGCVTQFREIFGEIDVNSDGHITKAELQSYSEKLDKVADAKKVVVQTANSVCSRVEMILVKEGGSFQDVQRDAQVKAFLALPTSPKFHELFNIETSDIMNKPDVKNIPQYIENIKQAANDAAAAVVKASKAAPAAPQKDASQKTLGQSESASTMAPSPSPTPVPF